MSDRFVFIYGVQEQHIVDTQFDKSDPLKSLSEGVVIASSYSVESARQIVAALNEKHTSKETS